MARHSYLSEEIELRIRRRLSKSLKSQGARIYGEQYEGLVEHECSRFADWIFNKYEEENDGAS